MAYLYDHIVHVRGIDITAIKSLNDRESIEALIDGGSFQEINPTPGISIYLNNDEVEDPQNVMAAMKNGQVVFKMNTLPQE